MSDVDADLAAPWVERLTARTWVILDVVLALVLAAGTLAHLFAFPSAVARAELGPLVLAATLPVAVRRRWPGATLVVVTLAMTVATAVGHSLAPDPAIAFPLYSLTLATSRRRSLAVLVAVEAALLAGLGVAALAQHAEGDVTFSLVLGAATWVIGDAVRARRGYLAEQERLGRERALDEAARALVEERLTIARELHDVLAHSLAVIALQSGVGRHVIDDHPDQAREALAAVESTSRGALDELRRVLGALRADEEDRGPAPGLGDLDALAARVEGAGTPVTLELEGDGTTLAPGLQLSLYRIVQEALTNVVRHAPGARATVRLRVGPEVVDLEVLNTPSARTRPPGPVGHGLIGMRERASLYGGTLRAGPRTTGGFSVRAVLPHRGAT